MVIMDATVKSDLEVKEVWWKQLVDGEATFITSESDKSKYYGSTPKIPCLVIKDVQPSDSGTYTCLIACGASTFSSEHVNLNVGAQKLVDRHPTKMTEGIFYCKTFSAKKKIAKNTV